MVRISYVPNRETYRNHYGAGGGIPGVFKGDIYQDGYGIGGVIASLFRRVLPVIASTAKSAGKTLLRSGARVLSDVVSGERDLKSSLREHGIEGLKSIVTDIVKPRQKRPTSASSLVALPRKRFRKPNQPPRTTKRAIHPRRQRRRRQNRQQNNRTIGRTSQDIFDKR